MEKISMPKHYAKHEKYRLGQRAHKTMEEVQGSLKARIKKKKKKKAKGLKSPLKTNPRLKVGPLTEKTIKALEKKNKRINDLIDKTK
jgi:hypothetical protein